jgi:hypothetical protein
MQFFATLAKGTSFRLRKTMLRATGRCACVVVRCMAAFLLKRLQRNAMKFCLEVGETERHLIEFDFNQLLGQLHIRVNRKEVKSSMRLFDEPLTETHTLQIGEAESLTVRIEKERKMLFGQKCRVFLNDRLYKYYEGV